MEGLILIGLSFIPPLILLGLICWHDALKRDPLSLVLLSFVSGLGVFLFAMLVGYFVIIPVAIDILISTMDWLQFWLFTTFIGAGLLEEFGKLLVFMLLIWRRVEYDEVMDGIVYLVAIAMGFAAIETMWFGIFVTGMTPEWYTRGLNAVPIHAASSGIMGYFVGKAKKFDNKGLILVGLLLGVILHGAYDFWIVYQPMRYLFPAGQWEFLQATGLLFIVICAVLGLIYLITRARKLDSGIT